MRELRASLTSDRPIARNALLWGSLLPCLAALALAPFRPWTLLVLLPCAPILALAVKDLAQREHTLRRNFPVAARIRWYFEWLRPYLRAYIVESDYEGRPFSHYQRSLIYARSKGDNDSQPFGTELDVYAGDHEWFAHSIVPNPEAPYDMRVPVGSDQCANPYRASRLNVSAMSFGSLGAKAIEALNLGAKTAGCYHDTGEGGVSPYHLKHGGDLVWEIGSGYFGCRDAAGGFDPGRFADGAAHDAVKMIEIKLSQGAKPGHGGVLPAAKVSPEIARTRGVPEGFDCISPARHTSFSTPLELVEFAARLRELAGGKPVGIKLCIGQPHELLAVMKAMLETGITLDFVVIDGAEGGTGAAPTELSDRVGMPLREGLVLARNALVGAGLKEQIRLAAGGKVTSGASIAMNIALGADWCNAARAFMFSLGCVQSMHCHTDNCPTGIATQSPARQRGLAVPEKAARVARFHASTMKALHQLVVSAGLESPGDFRPGHLRQRPQAGQMLQMDELHRFVEPGELLAGSSDPVLRRWWDAADPYSFQPKEPRAASTGRPVRPRVTPAVTSA